jgi:hypothetical protein
MPVVTYAFAYDELLTSELPTERLLALAITLETVPGRSQLHGRDHAFYSIAHTQATAVEWVLIRTDPVERRRMAVRALADAGYTLANLPVSRDSYTRQVTRQTGDSHEQD